jgi:hypothetical protein
MGTVRPARPAEAGDVQKAGVGDPSSLYQPSAVTTAHPPRGANRVMSQAPRYGCQRGTMPSPPELGTWRPSGLKNRPERGLGGLGERGGVGRLACDLSVGKCTPGHRRQGLPAPVAPPVARLRAPTSVGEHGAPPDRLGQGNLHQEGRPNSALGAPGISVSYTARQRRQS